MATNLYVGNFPFDVTEDDLRELFEPYGVVSRVQIVTDRETGRSRGFGFVEMANDADVQRVVEALNGKVFRGRTLTVNEARPRQDSGSRPNGGGGGRRGDGYAGGYGGYGASTRPSPARPSPVTAPQERSPQELEALRLPPSQVTSRGTYEGGKEVQRDTVNCTVFAPAEAALGSSLLVQVFAHQPDQAEAARAAAQEFDADARRRGVTSLGTEIARGSRLTFELLLKGLTVTPEVRHLVWRGQPDSVSFEVQVPTTEQPRSVIGKVLVSQDTVPIGEVLFKLQLASRSNRGCRTTGSCR